MSGLAQASSRALNAAAAASIPAPESQAVQPNGGSVYRGAWVAATIPFEAGPKETLAQCMSYWDPGTHMSKFEWHRACQRTGDGPVSESADGKTILTPY